MAKARVVNTQFNDESIDFTQYTNHLLAEGDSWFAWAHLNLAPSSNIPEQLEFREPTVIVNLAYSGEVVRNMSDPSSNMHFYFELQGQRYHAILLSGGGNDLIDALQPGNGQPGIIVPCDGKPAAVADSYVDTSALKALTDNLRASYGRIIAQRDASDANANTPIVLHTYDYPTPRNAKATFMSRPGQRAVAAAGDAGCICACAAISGGDGNCFRRTGRYAAESAPAAEQGACGEHAQYDCASRAGDDRIER